MAVLIEAVLVAGLSGSVASQGDSTEVATKLTMRREDNIGRLGIYYSTLTCAIGEQFLSPIVPVL